MSTHIEARSLSSLNSLADNPPQYPVNPAETPRESLTLYISRVPGSRDIILSTLKPQLKSISAEDVGSSLYYVHLQLPSEEDPVPPQPMRSESPRKTIPRKPVPSVVGVQDWGSRPAEASGALEGRAAPLPLHSALPQLQVQTSGLGQGDGTHDITRAEREGNLSQHQAPHRRPAGPRSMGAPSAPPKNDHVERTTPASATSGPLSTPTSAEHSRTSSSSFPDSRHTHIHRPRSPTRPRQAPTFTPSTLTLIRREPTSNHQQNVARITTVQTNIPTPDMAAPDLSPNNMPGPPPPLIKISIKSPGYSRFSNWPTKAAIDKYAANGHLDLRPGESMIDGPGRRARGASFTVPQAYEPGFNREVVMTYGKSWASNIKSALHIRNKSREVDDDFGLTPPRAPGLGNSHRRQDSGGSTGSLDSNGSWTRPLSAGGPGSPSSPPAAVVTRPGPGYKAKGYMFTSPWDGRCEFRTGQGGRSLICRHILDPSSSRSPTAALGHGHDGARTVSELRFNLPGGSSGESGQDHDHRHSFQGKFDRLLKLDPRQRRHDGSSDEYDDYDEVGDSSLDLQLGYERAGGGRRGNRAKLGKLIVHDEGLKMLDLVVAANVGMLWVSWEKIS